jgi:hypothetical protein
MPYEPSPEIKALIGTQVVVDTDSAYVYVGTLDSIGSDYFGIVNVDVHDTSDSKSTKEQYAHETKKVGLRTNRNLTYVRIARVVSISKLDDIITF